MEGIVILIVLLVVVIIFFVNNKKETIQEKKYFQDVFDAYNVSDYKLDANLIRSIKYALSNEVFEYEKVEDEPVFPEFIHALKYRNYIRECYTADLQIEELVTSINEEFGEAVDDYTVNELYEVIGLYRLDMESFNHSKTFCTNYLLDIGFICQETFTIDGQSIVAYRTLRVANISYKHFGSDVILNNFIFNAENNDEIKHHNNMVDYFEQILIKILRENKKYISNLHVRLFKDLIDVEKPLKSNMIEKYYELILRIRHVLNAHIKATIPVDKGPNFLSSTCDQITASWSSTRESLLQQIEEYNVLVGAYTSNNLETLLDSLCYFERANFLLSADTLCLVNSVSRFKNQVLSRFDELEYSLTGKMDQVQSDMELRMDQVQASSDAAATAATVAAVQSTRSLNRLK